MGPNDALARMTHRAGAQELVASQRRHVPSYEDDSSAFAMTLLKSTYVTGPSCPSKTDTGYPKSAFCMHSCLYARCSNSKFGMQQRGLSHCSLGGHSKQLLIVLLANMHISLCICWTGQCRPRWTVQPLVKLSHSCQVYLLPLSHLQCACTNTTSMHCNCCHLTVVFCMHTWHIAMCKHTCKLQQRMVVSLEELATIVLSRLTAKSVTSPSCPRQDLNSCAV